MSNVSDGQNGAIAQRVAEALKQDFPEWVASKEAQDAATAQDQVNDSKFLLVSDWVLLPDGLRKFTTELRGAFQDAQVTYDVKTSWPKITCPANIETEVMAACQVVLEDMLHEELTIGLSSSTKVVNVQEWRTRANPTSGPTVEMSMLAAAPPQIQAAPYKAAWMVPQTLFQEGQSPLKLEPAEILAKLQHITGCTLALENDRLAVLIGGQSLEATALVIRKLETLAKHTGASYEEDINCESFVYAEDMQYSMAAFTYVETGPKHILETYFFDRATYELTDGVSMYGKIFEKGVVIALPRGDSHPMKGPERVIPAISYQERHKPYKAFTPTVWHYEPNPRLRDLARNLFNSSESWVEPNAHNGHAQLSNPNQGPVNMMQDATGQHVQGSLGCDSLNNNLDASRSRDSQAWGLQELSQQPYENQHEGEPPNMQPVEEDSRTEDSMTVQSQAETAVEETSDILDNLKTDLAEQGLKEPDRQCEELLIDISGDDEDPPRLETQAPQHLPVSQSTLYDDPFAGIWRSAQIGIPRVDPTTSYRPRHSTMKQQASRQLGDSPALGISLNHEHAHRISDLDHELTKSIVKKLVQMTSTLKIFTGRISLKANLGRLCLTKVDRDSVCVKDNAIENKLKSLHDIKEALDKHYTKPQDLIFTKVLTEAGEDANYIAFAKDHLGQRMWSPTTRHTVYEVHCCAKLADGNDCNFTVEIDTRGFTHKIYDLDTNFSSVFVHCPKRVWDFQIALSKSQDLSETFGSFAKDLVNNMRVVHEKPGTPLLEFNVKEVYKARILLVRTRNVASYTKKVQNIQPVANGSGPEPATSSILEIHEVHDMAPKTTSYHAKGNMTIMFEQYGGASQLGQLPIWYEASLQSKVINEALEQNQNLELGEQVTWTPERLQEAGAFDDIVKSAIEVVKQIDGVGYWGDNCQDVSIHGVPSPGKKGGGSIPSVW
ncbi:hypothetical protein F5Y11DRAFT_312771 [Daldinia sp. FL1419]|nr:hypothetical protein F5Y11DRAFT_312771 [Daldinia sp. FL1419]